jgi:amidohydrolase
MILDDCKAQINKFIAEEGAQFADLAIWLAQNPEFGRQEFKASAKMASTLSDFGFSVQYPFLDLPTAFKGQKGTGSPVIAFLAEYDALPGIGHGCGHNLSGVMSLLAACALASLKLDGQIAIFGTPAEETEGAKLDMAERSAFSGVDLAMMIHANGGYSSPHFRTLAVVGYEFTFTGQSTHAASSPTAGRSALSGLRLFFNALDLMRPQLPSQINIHGIISQGGQAPNVVPETAKAVFYFRAPDKKLLNKVLPTLFNCARGAALATETTADWRIETNFYDSLLPNKAAEEAVSEIFSDLGISFISKLEPGGSSDVGEVSRLCPTVHPFLDISRGETINLHTSRFAQAAGDPALAAQAVMTGAKVLSYLGLKTLTEEGFKERLWADFKAASAGSAA